MYCNENHGWMPSGDTCGPLFPDPFTLPDRSITTAMVGWVDGGPTDAAITNGTLWPHLHERAVYHCPGDRNSERNRSYSMNGLLDIGNVYGVDVARQFEVYKANQVTDAARCIEYAEECDPRALYSLGHADQQANVWNANGWDQWPAAVTAGAGVWIDTVASWDRGGANFAFVDGHAEHWPFIDPRTLEYMRDADAGLAPFPYVTPNNPDLARIQHAVCTWRQQRP